MLSCGCLVGIYETYKGDAVATIDARGPNCTDPNHRLHRQVAAGLPGEASSSTVVTEPRQGTDRA